MRAARAVLDAPRALEAAGAPAVRRRRRALRRPAGSVPGAMRPARRPTREGRSAHTASNAGATTDGEDARNIESVGGTR